MSNPWMNVYPRPQLRRDSFFSLNGPWRLNGQTAEVPFPPQAPASGYRGPVGAGLVYERTFALPDGFTRPGERVILHLGAVDQTAFVFVNDRPAVRHEGGYLPFSADITPLLRPGENTLRVEAEDTLDHLYPYGKQCEKPHGMWYTAVSGIWRSVWLESVPEEYIHNIICRADAESVTLTVSGPGQDAHVQITLDGQPVTQAVCPPGQPVRIPIPAPRPWSPERPVLYDALIRCGQDRVSVYFGLRSVAVCADARGVERVCLNGSPVFLSGVLDQSYFPDGLFLPGGGPAGYEEDIRRMRAMGFNTLRLHIKVEDESFYEACDRLGMLVIQDMVQSGAYSYFFDTVLPNLGCRYRPDRLPGSRKRRAFFEQHCLDIQDHLRNHPCVVVYTIFNEGWGQFDTTRLYRTLKKHDPDRLYISASGWFKGYETDLDSEHVYFRLRTLKGRKRPLILSECGGYARPVQGHLSVPDGKYGYGEAATEQALTDRILLLMEKMVLPAVARGLCGFVYTQLSDVEAEINGLYTYDRAVCKVSAGQIRRAVERLSEELERSSRAADRDPSSGVRDGGK